MYEPELDKRIEQAKKRAETVYYGTSSTLDDEIMRLCFILSREYKIPIFSQYFVDRTVDELIFEVELIRLSKTTGEKKMADIVQDKDSKKELDSLFDDWGDPPKAETPKNQGLARSVPQTKKEEEHKTWVDLPTSIDDNDMMEQAKKFMETGEFIIKDSE